MRPRERRETGEQDLFRSRLDQIIDMNHPLAKLARTVDWRFLEGRFGEVYTDDPGHPPLPGNPYDGHTLATVIPEMETLVGHTIARILADKGYRGHNAPPDHKFRVFISGQKRGVTPSIKRQLRRRSAVEPVIGHLKAEHRMGRNYF